MRYDRLKEITLNGEKVVVFAEYDGVYKNKYNPELLFIDAEWAEKPYQMLLKNKFSEVLKELVFGGLVSLGAIFFMLLPATYIIFTVHLAAKLPEAYSGIAAVMALLVVVDLLVCCVCVKDGVIAKALLERFFKGKRFRMGNNELMKVAKSHDKLQQLAVSTLTGFPTKKKEETVVEKSKKSTFVGSSRDKWTKKEKTHVEKRAMYLKRLAAFFDVSAEEGAEAGMRRVFDEQTDSYVRFLGSLTVEELQSFVEASFRFKELPGEIAELKKLAAKNVQWKRTVFSKDLADRITEYEAELEVSRKLIVDIGERFEKNWQEEKAAEVDAETLRALAA